MRYGFVIDHRKCIGCHACTVACKEENQVPLGSFRTWVKYVEKGTFPDTRRYFSVLRCNHCDDAPCVTICPTRGALPARRRHRRLRLRGAASAASPACRPVPTTRSTSTPTTNTAAKCHYCAHRIEVGLEPACVVVCPERAIIAGDLDDPRTEIARLVARENVRGAQGRAGDASEGVLRRRRLLGADAAAAASGDLVSVGAAPGGRGGSDADGRRRPGPWPRAATAR